MSPTCDSLETKSLFSFFASKKQQTPESEAVNPLTTPRSLPNLKPPPAPTQDPSSAKTPNRKTVIFDSNGKLMPLKYKHFLLEPDLSEMRYYTQLPIEELLALLKRTNRHGIELFIEIHRRAAASFLQGQGLYYWDCVSDKVHEDGQNDQLERARMVMAYDHKWDSSLVNATPSWFQYPEDGKMPTYIAVARTKRRMVERHLQLEGKEKMARKEEEEVKLSIRDAARMSWQPSRWSRSGRK